MSQNPSHEAVPRIHPDFDGHLAKPLAAMTPEEKPDFIWQGMCLLRASRQAPQRDSRSI